MTPTLRERIIEVLKDVGEDDLADEFEQESGEGESEEAEEEEGDDDERGVGDGNGKRERSKADKGDSEPLEGNAKNLILRNLAKSSKELGTLDD